MDSVRVLVRGSTYLRWVYLLLGAALVLAFILVDSGLVETRNGMRVDYDTLVTRWGNVFAIGDCADMPVSKSGGVAHQQAEVVANNLAVELTGEGDRSTLRLHTL